MLHLGPKLNRRYSMSIPIFNVYGEIDILYHTNTNEVKIALSQDFFEFVKNNNYKYDIYQDIKTSYFASTFLNLKNIITTKLDIVNQYDGIRQEFREHVHPYFNEKQILHSKRLKYENGHTEDSTICITIFGVGMYGQNYMYMLIERMTMQTKKIVRTFGMQLTTKQCLSEMIHTYNINNINNVTSTENIKVGNVHIEGL